LLTETVKSLDFIPALIRLQHGTAGALGQLTGDDCSEKKRKKSNPVLRVGDCKLIEWREKKIIKAERSQYRHECGVAQTQ
jgi:hypothetical protein